MSIHLLELDASLRVDCCWQHSWLGGDEQRNKTDSMPFPLHVQKWARWRALLSFLIGQNIRSDLCVYIFLLHPLYFRSPLYTCRSPWPRGLRHRSAAARLLRLWVRIPPEAYLSVVSVVCCRVEVCATSWWLVQRSPTDCGASLCVWSRKPRE